MNNDKQMEENEIKPEAHTDPENKFLDPEKQKEADALNVPNQGSSSPMGGENNYSGNSADRQGDTTNSSGGSYQKSNKDI